MFSRFSVVLVFIITLTHGVNTQNATEPTTNTTTTTIPPTTSLPTTVLPTISPNTTASPNTTISPNTTTASPTTTPIPLCPSFDATSHQKFEIEDLSGRANQPTTSISSSPNNTLITVSCENGYRISNELGIAIKCNSTHWLNDGKIWDPSTTPCVAIATIPPQKVCPPFSKLEQQTAKLSDGSSIDNGKYPIDTHIITTCAPGYRNKTTEDSVIVTCIEQEGIMKWDGKGIQSCLDIECPTVPPPPHGHFAEPPPSKLVVNTTIRIICDPGYHVIRDAGDVDDIITCINTRGDASWDQATPRCEIDTINNNNNNNTFIDRNLTGTKEVTNDNKAKNVAGGVIGGILGLAIIIICIYCLCAQHARTGRWVNLGTGEPKHDGEELQSMNAVRGSADDDV